MELFLQQVVSGFATGGIYACMALSVVMIYQAIHHLNFAQGEMAMFSTYIAWQVMVWGMPYWVPGLPDRPSLMSFDRRLCHRADRLQAHRERAPVLSHIVIFIALFAIFNSVAGFIWDFTIKSVESPFGSGPFMGSTLLGAHQAGMIGVTLVMLVMLWAFFSFTRIGLAMRAAAANPESARLVGIRVSMMTALGWGMASAIGAVAGILCCRPCR